MREYYVYFPFFILHDWSKRSAEARSSHCAVLPIIKTQRLMLTPMGTAELERKIAQLGEGELRQAYREKQAAQLSVVYMMLGMICGISLGITMGKMSIGVLLGTALGFALGSAVDSSEKKHRQQVLSGKNEK